MTDLESMARQSDDAALACEAHAAAHRPEYERCLPATPADATPEMHARALELYPHVVVPEREAERLRAEAAALRRADDLLRRAYGVVEWVVGEGYALPAPYPDADELYLAIGDYLGTDQEYKDITS